MKEKMPFAFACLLIALFIYSVVVPAHEYPMRTEQVLSMVLNGGILIGLVGARGKIPGWLFWTGLVCGIGLFAIRFTSDAAWWTGHLMYSLR